MKFSFTHNSQGSCLTYQQISSGTVAGLGGPSIGVSADTLTLTNKANRITARNDNRVRKCNNILLFI